MKPSTRHDCLQHSVMGAQLHTFMGNPPLPAASSSSSSSLPYATSGPIENESAPAAAHNKLRRSAVSRPDGSYCVQQLGPRQAGHANIACPSLLWILATSTKAGLGHCLHAMVRRLCAHECLSTLATSTLEHGVAPVVVTAVLVMSCGPICQGLSGPATGTLFCSADNKASRLCCFDSMSTILMLSGRQATCLRLTW